MDSSPCNSAAPLTTIARRPDGELVVVCGASGSGKSLYTMRAASSAARLIVWDSHLEWSGRGARACGSIAELAAACRTREPAHLAYIGPVGRGAFWDFCRVALCWLKLGVCTVVVEELADVSPPGKAPPGWSELIRWARKLGGTIYGISQRPQETDKTILDNAHRVVIHAPGSTASAAYLAERLDVPLAEITALRRDRLEHIERRQDGTRRRGRTVRPNSRPV